MRIFGLTIVLALFLSSPCFAIGIDWNSNIITAIGVGAAPEYAIKPGQADALARRAAVVDAYRNMASIVYGVEIENQTTVAQLVVKKDTIKTAVAGAIKNARVVDEEQLDNGDYQITLCMPLYGPNSLSAAVWTGKNSLEPDDNDAVLPLSTDIATATKNSTEKDITVDKETPKTADQAEPAKIKPVAPQSAVPEGAFSGLVVDCRGLNLERAMAPNIVDVDGKTIYGSKNIMDTAIIQHGLVGYSRSDNPKDWPYVGNNPLVIKATGLADFHQNPVVRKEDGEAVLAAVQKYDFLKNCSVIFLQ